MKLIEVIPISRGINKETLTYFSAADIPPGHIVSVPVRGRALPALTLASSDVQDAKAMLRSLEYPMKKLDARAARPFILEAFVAACCEVADYFVSTTGSVLYASLPQALFEAMRVEIGPPFKINAAQKNKPPAFPRAHETLLLQTDDEGRFTQYKNIIRGDFARNASTLLIMPTLADMERPFVATLTKGIKQYAFFLHGALSRTEQVRRIRVLLEEEHPILLIATGGFLSLPRSDIGTIIIEQEASRAYKSVARPFLDARTVAETFARHAGVRIIFGGDVVRAETVWRYKNNEMIEFISPKFRMARASHPAVRRIVDMRRHQTSDEQYDPIISKELKEIISRASEASEGMFLFTARRGLAPLTICSDCDTPVLCPNCSAPRVLHRSGGSEVEGSLEKEKMRPGVKNIFLCHKCGALSSADIRCNICKGWRFAMLGIGSELVADTLTTLFPDVPLFRIDTDTTRTHKQALAVARDFFKTSNGVLIGTEKVLPYLVGNIPHAAIVSLDSLFALPDFSINERVLGIILALRARALKTLLIQTRNPTQRVLTDALEGNLENFYRDELVERQTLNYPPFSRLIKITRVGAREQVQSEMETVKELFATYPHYIFPAFTATVKGKYGMHALLKIPRREWPGNGELLGKLRALPPQYSVNVDPENVL